jgi:phosphoglycerate kinase
MNTIDFATLAGGYKSIDAVDVGNKRVIVRADLNVPLADGHVSDATRIERLLPTLRDLTGRGAKVIVLSHLGRPDGQKTPKYTLRPVADKLAEMLGGTPVRFIEDSIGGVAEDGVAALRPGEVAVLENLRSYPG